MRAMQPGSHVEPAHVRRKTNKEFAAAWGSQSREEAVRPVFVVLMLTAGFEHGDGRPGSM